MWLEMPEPNRISPETLPNSPDYTGISPVKSSNTRKFEISPENLCSSPVNGIVSPVYLGAK